MEASSGGGSAATATGVIEIEAAHGIAWVRGAPSAGASYDSQLVCGERFQVSAVDGEWAQGTCAHDGFHGFVELKDFDTEPSTPTHAVAARVAPVLAEPVRRSHPTTFLCLGSAVRIRESHAEFLRWARGGWLYRVHLEPWPSGATDLTSATARLEGVPFVWGGRSSFGTDCSGFIQTALARTGRCLPRDLDDQAHFPGSSAVGVEERAAGDLVLAARSGTYFHGGLLIDRDTVAHAGRRYAGVGREPFRSVVRAYALDAQVGAEPPTEIEIRRLPPPAGDETPERP